MTRLLLADVLPLEDPAAYATLYREASPERRRVADSFRFVKDRNLSIGAAALLDRGLGAFGLRERDMKYGRSAKGKPFFLNAPEIHFSISHSGTKVAVAFGDEEIGCDIEQVTGIDMGVAERFFSQEEYLTVKAAETPAERFKTFFRYWTLKESYMKATGLGLALPPESFTVRQGCAADPVAGAGSSALARNGVASVWTVVSGRDDGVQGWDVADEASADGFVIYTPECFEGYMCALCCRPYAGEPALEYVRLDV